MNFDLARIFESKRVFRQHLAARPIAEKLAILDTMRASSLALRASREAAPDSPSLREEPPDFNVIRKD